MDFVTELLNQYGYPILFLLGLVEFLGVPVATSTVLLLVGASAAGGLVGNIATMPKEVRGINVLAGDVHGGTVDVSILLGDVRGGEVSAKIRIGEVLGGSVKADHHPD
ncbi:MAG: hypothetical protein WBM96_14885 [Polyangiales bacterium]|jgi:hypothetical protein